MATNSHLEYTDLLLKTVFGDDWRELFDVVICDARKPLFQRSDNPFFELDSAKPDNKGEQISSLS